MNRNTHTHTETELNKSSYASLTNLAVLIQFGCWPMGWRNCCVSKRFISLYEYYCRAPPDQETELVQSWCHISKEKARNWAYSPKWQWAASSTHTHTPWKKRFLCTNYRIPYPHFKHTQTHTLNTLAQRSVGGCIAALSCLCWWKWLHWWARKMRNPL